LTAIILKIWLFKYTNFISYSIHYLRTYHIFEIYNTLSCKKKKKSSEGIRSLKTKNRGIFVISCIDAVCRTNCRVWLTISDYYKFNNPYGLGLLFLHVSTSEDCSISPYNCSQLQEFSKHLEYFVLIEFHFSNPKLGTQFEHIWINKKCKPNKINIQTNLFSSQWFKFQLVRLSRWSNRWPPYQNDRNMEEKKKIERLMYFKF